MSAKPADLHSPLASTIRDFLVHHRALGKRFDTEEASLRLLDRYLCVKGTATVEAITPAVLNTFLRSRPRRSARSYNHLLNVLQRFFHWLERQQILVPAYSGDVDRAFRGSGSRSQAFDAGLVFSTSNDPLRSSTVVIGDRSGHQPVRVLRFTEATPGRLPAGLGAQ